VSRWTIPLKSLLLNLRNLIHCEIEKGAVGKTLPFHPRLKLLFNAFWQKVRRKQKRWSGVWIKKKGERAAQKEEGLAL